MSGWNRKKSDRVSLPTFRLWTHQNLLKRDNQSARRRL